LFLCVAHPSSLRLLRRSHSPPLPYTTLFRSKTLAAMSLAARKTLRRRFDRLVRIYLWVVVALMAVSLWLSLDEPPSAALYAVFIDRKSTRLNSSHVSISYAVFCLKQKTILRA